MAWTAPKTWTATVLPASELNTYVRDNENVLKISIDDNGHIYDPVILTKTANYTITGTDDLVICTANSFTITLPTAVGRSGKSFKVKNTGTGVITMASTSSQTIDGLSAGTTQLFQYDSLTFESDGANWVIV
jgi:hypothetical protein